MLERQSLASTRIASRCAAAWLLGAALFATPRDPKGQSIRLAEEYLAAANAAMAVPAAGFPDRSLTAVASWQLREDGFLRRALAIDIVGLGGSTEGLLLGALRETLESSIGTRVCRNVLRDVDPVEGWHILLLPREAREQRVGSAEARLNAITRWKTLSRFVDIEIANLREGMRQGFTAPRVSVEAVIAQLDGLLKAPTSASAFFDPARRDTASGFRAEFQTVVDTAIVPALRRYRDFLAGEYVPVARPVPGLLSLPEGDACWRAEIRRALTLAAAPSTVDSIGRVLLAQSGPERDRLARERYALPDGRALSGRFESDPALGFTSRAEAMDTARKLLDRVAGLLPDYFGRLPTPLLPVLDTVTFGSGLQGSYQPARSNGRPARVILNPRDMDKPPARLRLVPILLHEAVPGHHLQVGLAPQSTHADSLLARVGYNLAFAEGWATYAAFDLAHEMGLRGGELWEAEKAEEDVDEAVELVVADGIHRQGWSLDQAIDTLAAYSATPREELREAALYFLSQPGDNLAYTLGSMEFVRLRHEAQAALGPRFELRRFHDMVLRDGQLPMALLRTKVAGWVQQGGK